MILRKLSIVLILIVLLSFGEAKDECPLQCDCSEDFSVVRCRGLEKFPVFGFASKVKTLDVTYGNIKYIHEKDVKAYTNLENLFISHNPLGCDHATTYTLKHVLRETAGLKVFDGHKIKCQRMMPLMNKDMHGKSHHPYNLPGPHIHFHPGSSLCYSPLMVAGAIVITIFALLAVAGVRWVIINYRHKLFSARGQDSSNAQDTVIQMEEGHGDESDTAEQALIKGLKKQRRGTQGYPENAIVDSDEDDVVEQEDYIKEKMKKQRRFSQGYAASSGSSDEESTMVEINLNEDLYASRK